MIDTFTTPYRIDKKIATWDGEWTAEQIDNGEAPSPKLVETSSTWFENIDGVPTEIIDPKRIEELERKISE